MRIGMTYDLRDDYLAQGMGEEETAEFDSKVTIDAVEAALRGLGFEVDRIGNLGALLRRLVAGHRWDLVFNIAEGVHGIGREAQVPAVLDAYRIPYTFSDPLTLALTLDKGMAKHVVRDRGVPTAPFAVVREPADIADVDVGFPAFAKPIGEGTGKGIGAVSRVANRGQLETACRHLLDSFAQPVIVETFLPGREFTVGVVGTGRTAAPIAVMEVLPRAEAATWSYGFEDKENYEERVDYAIVDDAEARTAAEVAVAAWRALNCRDGGRVDLRSDANGVPNFMEVNPLAGIHPVRSDLVILSRQVGIDYDTLIGRIVAAALDRLGMARPDRAARRDAVA